MAVCRINLLSILNSVQTLFFVTTLISCQSRVRALLGIMQYSTNAEEVSVDFYAKGQEADLRMALSLEA